MTSKRPRGFIENWKPSTAVRTDENGFPLYAHSPAEIVAISQGILSDNSDILPLTLRQIFYLMVSNNGFEKTERAYKRLCETMSKARRAQLVDMNAIRDDGFRQRDNSGWQTEGQFINACKSGGAEWRTDRQGGQDTYLMVWCEAGGMVPLLDGAAKDFAVPVLSSGGFDSLTTKHDMAETISHHGKVEILHIGDHDPSGVHICSSLDEDLQAFVSYYGGEVNVTRLAVTPEQVRDMHLPAAPPKLTDKRSFDGHTTQAEAIPPRKLREMVVEAIEARMDPGIYDAVIERELEVRASLEERLRDI